MPSAKFDVDTDCIAQIDPIVLQSESSDGLMRWCNLGDLTIGGALVCGLKPVTSVENSFSGNTAWVYSTGGRDIVLPSSKAAISALFRVRTN